MLLQVGIVIGEQWGDIVGTLRHYICDWKLLCLPDFNFHLINMNVSLQKTELQTPKFTVTETRAQSCRPPKIENYRPPKPELQSLKFRVTEPQVQSYRTPKPKLQTPKPLPLPHIKRPVPLNPCFSLYCGSVGP